MRISSLNQPSAPGGRTIEVMLPSSSQLQTLSLGWTRGRHFNFLTAETSRLSHYRESRCGCPAGLVINEIANMLDDAGRTFQQLVSANNASRMSCKWKQVVLNNPFVS